MAAFDPRLYGARWADNYDEWHQGLMAQLAGLEREDRWSDWKGTPFGPKSELHVSIYRKP